MAGDQVRFVRFNFDVAGDAATGAFGTLITRVEEASTLITVQPRGPGGGNPQFFVTVLAGGEDERALRQWLQQLDDDDGSFTEEVVTAPAKAEVSYAEAAANESARVARDASKED
jgi:hypothetical protein